MYNAHRSATQKVRHLSLLGIIYHANIFSCLLIRMSSGGASKGIHDKNLQLLLMKLTFVIVIGLIE